MIGGDLQALGALLRQARESRALSLEEAEEQTRIRAKFLQALENGDLSVLPSATHARGFLRNYALFLRLDADAIVARFAELTGSASGKVTTYTAGSAYEQQSQPRHPEGGPTAPAFDQTPAQGYPPSPLPYPPTEPTRPTRSTYIPPGQRTGPALPLGAGGPAASRQEAARPDRPRPAALRLLQSNVIVGGILIVGMIAVAWWAISQLNAISGEEFLSESAGTLAPGSGGADLTASPSATFAPTSTPTLPPIQGPLDRVLISITVVQRTWTRIEVDGEAVFEGQAEPGTVLQYEGRESILILTGNAAGLLIIYNGNDIGPLGERGEVVQRWFTPSGQITPTSTPTVTTTPTPVPTPTPRR